MKTTLYSLALAAVTCGLAGAQATTAYTTPVGYVSLGDTTNGQPAVKGNTDSYISVPLYRPSLFSGTVSSVAGNVITITGAPGFTVNGFVSTSTPHMALVESGSSSGLVGLISSNTANSVTLLLQPGESTTGVANGDKISIRLAWTLGSIFSGSVIPSSTQVSTFGANIGINRPADAIYEWTGTVWENTDDFEASDNVVIYPGEGIRLRSPFGQPISSIVVSGEVPASKSRILLSKPSPTLGQDNMITFVSPVDQIIGASGLGATVGDQLIIWNNSTPGINKPAATILEYTGSIWEDTDSFDDVTNTFSLKGGVAYRYRRAAAAPAGTIVGTATPSYLP